METSRQALPSSSLCTRPVRKTIRINSPSTPSPTITRLPLHLPNLEVLHDTENVLQLSQIRSILDRLEEANKPYIRDTQLSVDQQRAGRDVMGHGMEQPNNIVNALSEDLFPSRIDELPSPGKEEILLEGVQIDLPTNPVWEQPSEEILALVSGDNGEMPGFGNEENLNANQDIARVAERDVKEEVELFPMEIDAGSTPASANSVEESSVPQEEEIAFDVDDANVAGGPSHQAPHRTRRRGTKRGRCEIDTGYWLRSQKPASTSKRTRRTRYWLRP